MFYWKIELLNLLKKLKHPAVIFEALEPRFAFLLTTISFHAKRNKTKGPNVRFSKCVPATYINLG